MHYVFIGVGSEGMSRKSAQTLRRSKNLYPKTKAGHNKEIIELHKSGATTREIADELGLSVDWVRIVINKIRVSRES